MWHFTVESVFESFTMKMQDIFLDNDYRWTMFNEKLQLEHETVDLNSG